MRLRRQQPVLITSAADPRHVDIHRRQSQYLFWMACRVLCFVLAVVLFHGWIRFLAVVAALIIPWVAVVVANGGPAPARGRPVGFRPASHSVDGGPASLESAEHPVVEGDDQDGDIRYGPEPEPGPEPYPARGAMPTGSTPSPPDQPTVDARHDPRYGAPAAAPPPRPAERADVGFFGPRRPPRR
ncbi:DUF3099 domain-containing protein [Pseudofrankia asymbiotica]|uniref:DUF3099 domain-containing protein n=1 Tax=Pseudofrankia asymbiotica TaxID=1834516 RepID=UPI000976267E|nr:DUF3099 domain-containing protein [Pseudofrankia asymbiotica]